MNEGCTLFLMHGDQKLTLHQGEKGLSEFANYYGNKYNHYQGCIQVGTHLRLTTLNKIFIVQVRLYWLKLTM